MHPKPKHSIRKPLITRNVSKMMLLTNTSKILKVLCLTVTVALMALASQPAQAETVEVKYHGRVSLDTFKCSDISRSSFIKRVCYQLDARYMVIRLKSTYYHYCDIGGDVIGEFMEAGSMGQYYNQNIKGSSYSCKEWDVPKF